MGFRINTNINAIDTQRNLMMTSTSMSTTMRRLSSGLRINSAADDAAGLAISQKLDAQVNGLNRAVQNAQDGISLVQTAEGALNETQSILQRMRVLAVQSANDTNTQTDRTAIQSQMNQLATELSRISNTTTFNTKNLLAGGFKGQTLQIGANTGENMSFGIAAMDASALGVAANGATVSTSANQANITSVSNVGTGFKNGINYTVQATALTAGELTDANGALTKGTTQGQNLGNEQLNSEGAFAGTATTNYTFRVSGVDTSGKKVTQIQYSTDGGSTWATSQGQIQKDGTYDFQVATSSASPTTDSGLKFNFSLPSSGALNPALGDQFTFTANPSQTVTVAGLGAITSSAGGTFTLSSITGKYNGTLSGPISLSLTTGAANTVASGSVTIGGQTYTLAAPGTAGAAATFASAAANKLTVNVMGLSLYFSATTLGATTSTTLTFANPTLTGATTASSSQINSTDAGNILSNVDYLNAAPGGAASTATAMTSATVTGQYTGASGLIYLTNTNAGAWSTAGTKVTLVTNTGTSSDITASVTGLSVAASTVSFTYAGATYSIGTVPGGAAQYDQIAFGVANNASSPGSDMAVTTTSNTGASTAMTQSQNTGNEILNTAGAFVGTATTNYMTQVTSVSGSQVTGIKYSTDGGTTWANATANALSNGSYTFQVQQKSSGGTTGSGGDSGLLLSYTPPANGVAPQVGDQYNFQAVASNITGTAANSAALGGTVTESGAYTGPYAGAVTVTLSTNASSQVNGVASIAIGSTTLDASQYQYNSTANTVSFLGMTYTVAKTVRISALVAL